MSRNESKSDFKNRIFRPITRRWGICFRSTQRYTVCGLTPRNLAASRTVRGYSLADGKVFRSDSRGVLWFIGFPLGSPQSNGVSLLLSGVARTSDLLPGRCSSYRAVFAFFLFGGCLAASSMNRFSRCSNGAISGRTSSSRLARVRMTSSYERTGSPLSGTQ